MWQPELIPEKDSLYFRIHKKWYRDGNFNTAAFADRQGQGGMSVDWCKYCRTPEECQQRAKDPQLNGVVNFNCGDVRRIPPLTVVHLPIQNPPPPEQPNRAHSEILGDKEDPEVRVKLERIMHWEIHVPRPWFES